LPFAFSPSFLQDNSALVCSFTQWYQQSGKISHHKMSFLQSGDETGSASFVLAFRQQINPPFEESNRRESCRTCAHVCTRSRRYERRDTAHGMRNELETGESKSLPMSGNRVFLRLSSLYISTEEASRFP
jgi:hypothetical protein